MFSKRSTSRMSFAVIAVYFAIYLSIAGAQTSASVANGAKSSAVQPSTQHQVQTPALPRGPVTPGELALKALRKNSNKLHSYGGGGSATANQIFNAALDYQTAGQSTTALAVADLNNDGFVDMVTADACATNNCTNGSVSVLLGNGDGTFQTAVSYNSGGNDANAVAIADVNGDGKPDLVVANDCDLSTCSNGTVSVLLGNGDGTFQAAVSYGTGGENAISIAIADVNNDGYPDLIVANDCANNNCLSGSVSILLGVGNGTFNTAVAYGAGGYGTRFVAVGDLNGDGKLDLAVANNCLSESNCNVGLASVLLGNGDGTFNAAIGYDATGFYTQAIVIGDVNGDGHLDLVAVNQCTTNYCLEGTVNVFLGVGDGTFQAAVGYNSGGQGPNGLALADINGDGKADLLVANQQAFGGSSGSMSSVLLGNGDGTFQTAVAYAADNFQSAAIVVADVNGDGKPDVLTASNCVNDYNCVTGAVSVLLGNGDGTLRGAIEYNPDGWATYSVATADVNGDGKLDLLLGNNCATNASCPTGAASVLLGNGDGTFQAGESYSSGGLNGSAISVADVNGDGKPDLLMANECADNSCSGGSIGVLLGNGDGTFQSAAVQGSGGSSTDALAIADVNGDGKLDLIAVSQCNNNTSCPNGVASVLLGNGDGTFQTAVSYNSGGQYAFSLAVADVNGDGKPDVVVANECTGDCTNSSVSVLLGNGDGTFQTAVSYNTGATYAFAVAIGDVNGDGHPDLVVANQCNNTNTCSSGEMSVLLGNGDGTFQAAANTATPILGGFQTIVLADFNGDHKLDVASGAGNVLLLGNGDGTFQTPITLGASGQGMAVGDFNGDGKPDLAVGGVAVLLNTASGFSFATTTMLANASNPSTFGQTLTFTATIAAQVSGTPTGTVTFSDGSTTLGQGTLSGGVASYSTASLAVGSHSITASYSGDSSFTASVSTALSQVVQQASTTTSLSGVTPISVSQNATFTATVAPGTSGVPTGTVNFLDGATQIGSASLNGSGVASFSTSSLTAGTHSITAVYSGDGNFTASTSTAMAVVVTGPGFTLSAAALSQASVAPGGSAQAMITITAATGVNPSNVTLSCSVAPVVSPAVNCSLGAVTVSGSTAASTLTVTTVGPQAALAPAQGGSSQLIALAMIPGLFLCGTGMSKPNQRKLLALCFIFLVLTGCMLQTACSGSSSSSPNTNTATPAGKYTVTVAGNASGMPQQTTSVALTVQ